MRDIKAQICLTCLGISMLCMAFFLHRRRILHCYNRGQKCPVCLWETESQWPGCNWLCASVLMESKGRDPAIALSRVKWSSRSCQHRSEGWQSSRKEETEETSNCCPHVSDCCFPLPEGGLEEDFEDSTLISAHMLSCRHQRNEEQRDCSSNLHLEHLIHPLSTLHLIFTSFYYKRI